MWVCSLSVAFSLYILFGGNRINKIKVVVFYDTVKVILCCLFDGGMYRLAFSVLYVLIKEITKLILRKTVY